MSERTVPSVACELCGEPFDPTESGGWCTNPDCGEWQYETYADYDPEASSARASATAADDVGRSQATSGVRNDAGVDDGATGAGADGGVDGADGTGDGADQESADAASTGSDDQATAEATDGTPDDGAGADETMDDGAVEETVDDGAVEETVDDGATEESADDSDADVTLEECPECGADVEAQHRFCTGCGTDLDGVRTAIAEVSTCPDCGEDVGAGDRYCRACGADVQAAVAGSSEDEVESDLPDELALVAYGRSVVVTPDDTVGRGVRSLITDAGRPDDEAVRVHREHVRFIREDGEFYLVDLGENPTAVNGEPLEKGDRVRIEPGDDLTLSEVVTLSIDVGSP